MDIDQFLNSEDKTFSIQEISNLLLSTSHHHKLYALRLLCSILEFKNSHNIFGIIFCDKYTNILPALKMISQTHVNRQDFSLQLMEIWVRLLDIVFDNPESIYC